MLIYFVNNIYLNKIVALVLIILYSMTYNLNVNIILDKVQFTVVKFATWEEGLMVQPSNHKHIHLL